MLNLSELLATAARVSSTRIAAEAERVDQDGSWPRDGFHALLESGLGGLVVSEAHGGCGHGLDGLARVCEVIAHECGSTSLCFGMHCVATAVIAAKADDGQVERYLRPIAAGRHITTLALSEPGTGVHFYFPQAALEPASESQFRVNGTKSFVTNGGHADSYVVSTASTGAEAVGEFSCVVIPSSSQGLQWREPWNGLGMRGNSSRTLELHDVLVSHADLLGGPGQQIWYVFNVVAPYFLVAMAGTYLGIASAALEEVVKHLSSRGHLHSGLGPADSAVVQHRLGRLWERLESARQLVYHAAAAGDAGADDALKALCAAKSAASGCAVALCNEGMTLIGGIGYRSGSRIHRLLRDARASHVMSPTTDLLYTWIGRSLLGRPLLGHE